MKTLKRLLIIVLLSSGIAANAQITLQGSYVISNIYSGIDWVYLKHSGYKYLYLHSDTLDVFNLNNSLYKRILIPSYRAPGTFEVTYVSEGLFDTDTLNIDYMVRAYSVDSLVIYKDNGSVVFRLGSASMGYPFGVGMGQWNPNPIVNTDSGTIMIVEKPISGSSIKGEQIYKLPGSLPCLPSCSGSYYTSISPINNTNVEMNVYPNPAISYANIYYTLPQGTTQGQLTLYDLAGRVMKEYSVTSSVDHLRLTTSDIASGAYFYQLSVNGNAIAAKKIIVVK